MDGIEFFKILSQDDEFCSELGRVVLAAGRLESLMIIQLGNESRLCKATLG
jgi:hypothetical protein